MFIYCKCNEILYTFAFLVELFDGDGRILHGKGNLCDISLLYLLKWVRSERHNRCQHFQIKSHGTGMHHIPMHHNSPHITFPMHHIPLYLNGCHPFQINDMVLVSLMSHLCAILTQPDIVIQVINEMTNQPSQLFSSLKIHSQHPYL